MPSPMIETKLATKLPPYEEECQRRIDSWHVRLKALAEKEDSGGLATLKTAIDAELAIADLKIKVRQADHAQWILWLQIGLPTIGAVVGAFIGGWLKKGS
jgi:hypothetical protein